MTVDAALYAEGMSLLLRSGVFEALEPYSRPMPIAYSTPNYAEAHIAEANRAMGFHEALVKLRHYRELFMVEKSQVAPIPDYGGTKTILANKIISEEEANAIRTNFGR